MRKISSNIAFALMATAICFCLQIFVSAQEITGTITGTVRDASGAIVPGATVNIADSDKGNLVVRTITTNDNGEYNAPNLPVGVYQITVEAQNFKKSVKTGIKLDVGQNRNVEINLEAGNIQEVVTIEADPVAVDLQSASSGTLINGDQVREIPVNNRNWTQLVTLAPGVSNDLSDQVYVGTTNPDGQANTVQISVNGARSSQNTFTVDGADVTDRGSNLTIQAYPSVDSIGEFRVLRSLYPAEAGRSGGGQVNVVTRSGGKNFSGSAYVFARNEAFNANNFLNNAVTNPQFGRDPDNGKAKRPPFRYYNYGWTLGGPVYFFKFGEGKPDEMFGKYEKTFFFFSQELRRDRRFSAASTVTVPDANLRNGIFPIDVCINRNNISTENCTVGNPGRLTAGTALPASYLNPTAAAYLNQIYSKLPLPNAATATAPYNLNVSLRGVADFRQEILKIDHSFTKDWSMYYRYQQDKIPTVDANALFSSGSGLPGVSVTSTNSPGKTHTFQTTYVVSPNFIIEGRYAYGYGAILSENIGTLSLLQGTIPVNLPYVNQKDRNPTVTGNGFTGLTSFGPYDNFSYKHNFNGGVTYIAGSHTMKFGAVYSIYRKNENALVSAPNLNEGNYSAFGNTVASGVTNSTLNQNIQRWANFLVGNVLTFSQARADYTADLRQTTIEAFGQDEWRAKNNLTLYYGVRYSYFPSPTDKNGRLTNFDPELFRLANAPSVTGAGARVVGTGNNCNGIIVNAQNFQTGPAAFNCTPTLSPYGEKVIDDPKTNFAPRFGLAWDPFQKGKTSIRTGYGIYHEQVLNGFFLQNIGTNPPYQETLTVSNTRLDAPAGTIAASTALQSLRAVQKDWHTPYFQHWSLDWQQQLTSKTIVTVGYYGSKGTHMIGLTELNSIKAGVANQSQCAPGNNYFGQTTAFTSVQCQPTGYAFRNVSTATGNPNPGFTDNLILDQIRPYRGYRSIAIVQPRYNSNYHSLQLSAQHRFGGSSQINAAYTWSKNLTDSQNDRSAAPQDTYDIPSEYARAALDRRHVLSINYVYELPFLKKQEGFVGKVLGGWQFNGIVTFNTGLPFTVITSSLDYAGAGITLANPTARPNLICDPNANAPQTFEQYFNTACVQQNPGITATGLQSTFGNAQRGIINGPPTLRFDLKMTKNLRFQVSENTLLRIQLIAEGFNIFNKTNFRGFSSLNVFTGGTNFGRIGSVRDPRTMQFGAKVNF